MWGMITEEEKAILRDELAKFLDTTDEKESKPEPKDHKCEEGITPIDIWIICKHCGDNMRKIK